MFDGCVYHLDGGFPLAHVSIHEDEIRRRRKVLRAADRAGGATTRQPRSSSACVTPRPIPLEAPVTTATGCWVVFIECLSDALMGVRTRNGK
jgi:hypothetical protein